MKLSADISLEPKRTQALFDIDRLMEQKSVARAAMTVVYADKADLAASVLHSHKTPPDWLILEATSKALTVSALCQEILDRAGEAKLSSLLLEEMRQRTKAAIRAASNEQAIITALEGFRSIARV